MCVHKRDGPLNTKYKHLTPYAGLKSLVDEVQFLLNAVLIGARSYRG